MDGLKTPLIRIDQGTDTGEGSWCCITADKYTSVGDHVLGILSHKVPIPHSITLGDQGKKSLEFLSNFSVGMSYEGYDSLTSVDRRKLKQRTRSIICNSRSNVIHALYALETLITRPIMKNILPEPHILAPLKDFRANGYLEQISVSGKEEFQEFKNGKNSLSENIGYLTILCAKIYEHKDTVPKNTDLNPLTIMEKELIYLIQSLYFKLYYILLEKGIISS